MASKMAMIHKLSEGAHEESERIKTVTARKESSTKKHRKTKRKKALKR